MEKAIKIYDTTLRDGTQSKEISLTVNDKLEIAALLDDLGVDYIELGWPGSNPKDAECFSKIKSLNLKRSKIAAFGSTRRKGIKAEEDLNLRAIVDSGAKTATLFGKTWIEHIKKQLNSTREENLESIKDSIVYLKSHSLDVFYDAEHFFDGYKDNREYAMQCLKTASESGASCIVLCDTNGGCMPDEAQCIVKDVWQFFNENKLSSDIGVHFHNDSDCAVANSLIVSFEVNHIQGTINGVGERTGNANLCSILPALMLKLGFRTGVDLVKLTSVSDRFNILANFSARSDQPYVGKNAFAHKGGIHVDAISKGASYESISPQAVGNARQVVLSDLSGSANIIEAARQFGFSVDKSNPGVKAMLDDVKRLEKEGYAITDLKAEQYLLAERHFGRKSRVFEIGDVRFLSEVRDGNDYNECVVVGTVGINNRETIFPVKGDKGGPVDAAYKCLQKMIAKHHPGIKDVFLVNYKVMIALDRGHESAVRVYIGFRSHDDEWATNGVNTNILKASLEAIEKGFRYYLLKGNS